MRSLVFRGPRELVWEEAPDPQLSADREALVRPVAVATCDLDRALVRGQTPFQGPLPMGHECVAEVLEVGDGVKGTSPGSLVSVPFQISCGECGPCRAGQTGNCESVPWQSAYGLPPHGADWGGFLSDAVRVPFADQMLVPLPDGVEPMAVASVSDNIVDAWRTVAPLLAEQPTASVLVVGGSPPGSIGLYAAGIAVALGSPRVTYLDSDSRRLEIARDLGADAIERPAGEDLGSFDVTVDASAEPDGLRLAVRSTAAEGTCTSTGIYFQNDVPLPLFEAYVKGITFHTGRVHALAHMPSALELVATGRLHPELVTTRAVDFDLAAEALTEGDYVKLVFTP